MRLSFHTLDVFTSTRLAGNPLAVVCDADGLDEEVMQRLAREFNLSETVFIQTPENPSHSARLRIFTPQRELPFAGHPTIGAAALLAWLRHGDAREHEAIVTLEEEVGLVRAGVVIVPGRPLRAEFDVPRLPVELDPPGPNEPLAAALGLIPADIGFDNHRPTAFSAGVAYIFVPVRDLAALSQALPAQTLWREGALAEIGAAYLYCRETRHRDHDFAARMFAPVMGIAEDPASGSAAAAFAGVAARFEALAGPRHTFTIEQGDDMGRPSLIAVEVELDAGRPERVRIGGDCVIVARGEITLEDRP
jgi:trans-2,3-dihydro-3-hydroxyanthranilate isomerase